MADITTEEAIMNSYKAAGIPYVDFTTPSTDTSETTTQTPPPQQQQQQQQSPNPLTTYAPLALGAAPLLMAATGKKSPSTIPNGPGTNGGGTLTPNPNNQIPFPGDPNAVLSDPLSDEQMSSAMAHGASTVYWTPGPNGVDGDFTYNQTPGSYAVNISTGLDGKTYNQTVLGQMGAPSGGAGSNIPGSGTNGMGGPGTGTTPTTLGQELQFGGEAAGAGFAGYELFGSVTNLLDKGVTLGHLATAAASFLGLALALHMMHMALMVMGWVQYGVVGWIPLASPNAAITPGLATWTGGIGLVLQSIGGPYLPNFLYWLTSPIGILAVGGLIVAAAILTDLLHGNPSSAETSLQSLPVWTTGKVLAIASTAAFINMGYNIDSTMPLTSNGISIPVTSLQDIFAKGSASALTNPDGSASDGVFTNPDGTPIPIVVQGTNGQNNEVIEVTPGANNMAKVKLYNLSDNLTFAAPTNPNGAYIPWSVNGKPNATALESSQHMNDLLAACQEGLLDPVSCQNAATWAASGGKAVTVGTTNN